MAFSQSSRNIRVENHTLYADCLEEDNVTWHQSNMDLDAVLGNINGSFQWGKKAFSQSAENIGLEDTSYLTAKLANQVGTYGPPQKVNLDEHIANINGVLKPYQL
ncbi:Cyanovirin-N [Ilyonectria robusta]|uniref:Cyanovirin-N n=1 Tax=Ilyonectria robusta TaxID=1079257 RepID=UPI001E8DD21E|nr:Cyanovirin-N [Ilyonectria robusta]KAH8738335.1 Cyanovirin-N [Ilyonectria robusta]